MKRWRRSELAELFNCSEATVDRMRRRGEFACVQVSKKNWYVTDSQLEDFEKRKTIPVVVSGRARSSAG